MLYRLIQCEFFLLLSSMFDLREIKECKPQNLILNYLTQVATTHVIVIMRVSQMIADCSVDVTGFLVKFPSHMLSK